MITRRRFFGLFALAVGAIAVASTIEKGQKAMATPGSKPKPTHLHMVQGTLRADRTIPNQPEAYGEIGEAPDYFNELQVGVWNEVKGQAPAGLLTSCDRACFEGYVVLLAARVSCIKKWNETNNAVMLRSDQAPTRMIVNPYLRRIQSLTEQLRILEGEFGFTPAARTRISLPMGGQVNDPLQKYL